MICANITSDDTAQTAPPHAALDHTGHKRHREGIDEEWLDHDMEI